MEVQKLCYKRMRNWCDVLVMKRTGAFRALLPDGRRFRYFFKAECEYMWSVVSTDCASCLDLSVGYASRNRRVINHYWWKLPLKLKDFDLHAKCVTAVFVCVRVCVCACICVCASVRAYARPNKLGAIAESFQQGYKKTKNLQAQCVLTEENSSIKWSINVCTRVCVFMNCSSL